MGGAVRGSEREGVPPSPSLRLIPSSHSQSVSLSRSPHSLSLSHSLSLTHSLPLTHSASQLSRSPHPLSRSLSLILSLSLTQSVNSLSHTQFSVSHSLLPLIQGRRKQGAAAPRFFGYKTCPFAMQTSHTHSLSLSPVSSVGDRRGEVTAGRGDGELQRSGAVFSGWDL